MKTFLYIKQHRRTSLKYFGKTSIDPYHYSGSGWHWSNHLRKHGNDVITLRVWEFDDIKECKRFALKFSIDNNIVSSKAWANMVNESGVGGWPLKWPPGSRDGDKNPFFGKKHSERTRHLISKLHKGKKLTDDQKNSISIALKGKKRSQTAKNNYSRSMSLRAQNLLDPSMLALREARSKNWKLLTPDKREITIRSLRNFCQEHGLNQKSIMSTLITKKPISSGPSKGWMILERQLLERLWDDQGHAILYGLI